MNIIFVLIIYRIINRIISSLNLYNLFQYVYYLLTSGYIVGDRDCGTDEMPALSETPNFACLNRISLITIKRKYWKFGKIQFAN